MVAMLRFVAGYHRASRAGEPLRLLVARGIDRPKKPIYSAHLEGIERS